MTRDEIAIAARDARDPERAHVRALERQCEDWRRRLRIASGAGHLSGAARDAVERSLAAAEEQIEEWRARKLAAKTAAAAKEEG